MGVVVAIVWMSFTVLAEVGVVADGTLEADAFNVRQIFLVLAQWTVAIDTVVTVTIAKWLRQWLIDRHKAMARVDELCVLYAIGAVVPVWAIQALVAHTVDELVAAITYGRVAHIPARVAEEVSESGHDSLCGGSLEGVARMVTMLIIDMALHAQIVVITIDAGNEFLLWKDPDTAVASAGWILDVHNGQDGLFLISIGSRNSTSLLGWDFGNRLGFGWHPLCGAVDNIAILHEALDHPVAIAGAVYARIDTSGAKVVVSVVTNAAVEVLILHGLVAVITVYHPSSAARAARLRAECKVCIMRCAGNTIEEAWLVVN
jgi:hypothetical protein